MRWAFTFKARSGSRVARPRWAGSEAAREGRWSRQQTGSSTERAREQKGQVRAKSHVAQLHGGEGACKAALGQHGVFLGVSEPRARTESRDSVSSGWGRTQRQNCPPKCGWAGSHQKRVKRACRATVSTLVAPWSHLNSFKDMGLYPQKFRRTWFVL